MGNSTNGKLKVLDLFSGIGGFSLGLERTGGFETVAFCEIDPFCRKVLAKHWPDVPIFEDVRELTGDAIGPVDVITGGYPCQPFSLAGKRAGEADDRHLWPEMYRLVAERRPAWVIGENVDGHITLGLDQVIDDLEDINYTARAFVIPACAVGAPHRRNRLWLVANPDISVDGTSGPASVEDRAARLHLNVSSAATQLAPWRSIVADMDSAVYGLPGNVDRLRPFGNAVVPQIPEIIGRAILMAENEVYD